MLKLSAVQPEFLTMRVSREGRGVPVVIGLAVLASSLFALWVGLEIGGPKATLWFDDLTTPLAALTGCVLCLRASARHQGRMRTFWLLFGIAMACWTLAEVVWGVYALILSEEVPVPSWADLGYLSAIPLAVAGLIVHPAVTGNRTRKTRSVLDGVVIATALLFLSWTLVLGALWRSTDLSTVGGLVTLAYPFGDVIIVLFAVLVLRGMGREGRLSLVCLLAGLLALALSDSAYTYMAEVASYSSSSGNLVDTGWIVAYLGIAVAAFSAGGEVAEVREVEPSGPSLLSLVSPLLVVILALTVAAVEIRLGHHLDRAGWVMAFVLIAVVLTRQALAVLELFTDAGGPRAGFITRLRDSAEGGPPGADGHDGAYGASRL
jgi:hypothetical protein